MKTAIHGGAIRKLSAKGYAGGGLIGAFQRITGIGESPEKKAYRAQVAAEKSAEDAAKNAPKPPAADNALGNYAAGTAMQQREKTAGLKNGGAISGPKGAIRAMANGGMAQKKSVEGAKLKGPGTPTSDDIPATVVDTGEPIKVATGERIVSAKQDAFLLNQAKAAGFKSIDEWLEAGTGKPVGPTISYEDPKGMKCGGAIKKMAMGGVIDESLRMAQIPTSLPLMQSEAVKQRYFAGHPNTGTEAGAINAVNAGNLTAFEPGISNQLNQQSIANDEAENRMFKHGGAIRKMAGGASPDDLYNPAKDSQQYNAANGIVATVPNRYRSTIDDATNAAVPAPKVGSDLASKWGIIKAMGSDVASLFDNKLGTTGNATKMEMAQQAPANNAPSPFAMPTANTSPTAPKPAGAIKSMAMAQPGVGAGRGIVNPAPAAGDQPVTLSGADGKDVGYGVKRFDIAGKSPLFTNMTDGAGMASNEKLVNRGAITPQNLAADNAMESRYASARANERQRQANAEQMAAETAQAQAINRDAAVMAENASNASAAKQDRQSAETTLSGRYNTPEQRMNAQRTLDSLRTQENARVAATGQSQELALNRAQINQQNTQQDQTVRRGQDYAAAASGAIRKLAQDKFGIEQSQEARAAAKDALDGKQRERLQSAFDAYDKDPSEKAAERVRVLIGKEKAPAPDLYDKIQTGVDPTTNAPIYSLYNKRTGETVGQQAKATALPPKDKLVKGQTYQTARGPAVWDGSGFNQI